MLKSNKKEDTEALKDLVEAYMERKVKPYIEKQMEAIKEQALKGWSHLSQQIKEETMVKCEKHNKGMIKTGRNDYVCPACNGMNKEELKAHLSLDKALNARVIEL